MEYHLAAIILIRACNASCDICGIESSPRCKEKLDTELIKKHINSMKDIPELTSVGLTGGEQFLDFELLKDFVQYITKCGKDVSVMTNCFWAKDYKTAYEKLSILKQLGLKNLGVSFDYYHNQFIPEESVRNALRAARQLSIITSINVMHTAKWTMGQLYDKLGEDLVDTVSQSFPCFPVGRAKEKVPEENFVKNIPSAHCYCSGGGNYTIKYDGTIYPCCSPYAFDTGLTFGNYKDNSAKETLHKLKSSRILYLLQIYGFDYFIKIAKEELGISVPEYVISSCELCALLFSKENITRFYPFVYETTEKLINDKKAKVVSIL